MHPPLRFLIDRALLSIDELPKNRHPEPEEARGSEPARCVEQRQCACFLGRRSVESTSVNAVDSIIHLDSPHRRS